MNIAKFFTWSSASRSLRYLTILCAAMATTGMFVSCDKDDDIETPEKPDKPDNPDTPDNPDNPDTPDARGTALYFDTEGSTVFPGGTGDAQKNISATKIDGEENGYLLTIDAAQTPQYIVTVPLKAELEKKNLKLTFAYKCEQDIANFSIQYLSPAAGEEAAKGSLKASTSVDTDENGWASVAYVINRDIEQNEWGAKDNMLRLNIQPSATTGSVAFSIKDIFLAETDEDQKPEEEFDPTKYELTFTPNRSSHWIMEDSYGIYSGVSFLRDGDEYSLQIDDSYTPNGESAAEHFIATDPLTRALDLQENQVVEMIFKYKASTAFKVRTGLYPFTDPGSDWPASFVVSNVAASADVDRDADGWATLKHDITVPVNKLNWGRNVDGGYQQIRFCILNADGSDELHPEHSGLTTLQLKDVHLKVRDKSQSEIDKDKPYDADKDIAIGFNDDNNRGYDTEVSNAAGVYELKFKASAPEHVVWTTGLERKLPGSEWALKLTYQCNIDVPEVNAMLFDAGFAFYQPFGNPFITAGNTGAAANEWKEVTIDLSAAINETRWNLDGKTGERMRINFNLPGEDCTLKLKDVKLVPKSSLPPVTIDRKPFVPGFLDDLNAVYDTKFTKADDGTVTLEYTAEAPEHVLWLGGPDSAIADSDYSITFSYQCSHEMGDMSMMLFDQGMTFYQFDGDPFVHFDDWKAASAGEWKTVTQNLSANIAKVNWNIGKSGERIRINFIPVPATGEAVTIKVKDIKVFPNEKNRIRRR